MAQATNTMPIRRKACTACFRGRRKCDLAFPVCGRCRRNQRGCQYDSPLQTLEDVVSESISCAAGPPLISGATSADLDVWPADAALEIYLESSRLLSELVSPCTDAPNMVTQLGAVQSISENMESWKWVAKELQSYPKSYAQLAETVFIHKALFAALLAVLLAVLHLGPQARTVALPRRMSRSHPERHAEDVRHMLCRTTI